MPTDRDRSWCVIECDAAGGVVIKSLSCILQQRLRTSDEISRYSGEKFAVILIDTPLEYAIKVIDEIRVLFSEAAYHSDDQVLHVILGCGVSSFPEISTPGELREAADPRFYMAINGGRNQVVGSD